MLLRQPESVHAVGSSAVLGIIDYLSSKLCFELL